MHQQFKPINYLEQQGLVQNCVLFIILFRTIYVKYICLLAISQPNRLRCVRRNPPFPAGESARVVGAPGATVAQSALDRTLLGLLRVVVAQAAVRLQILPWPTSRQFHANAGTVVSYGRGPRWPVRCSRKSCRSSSGWEAPPALA